jgi:hypothetical protein
MVELLGTINMLRKAMWVDTYQRILLPEPATDQEVVVIDHRNRRQIGRRRTLSMDPQERPLCVPFLESVGLSEPFCGSTVMRPTGSDVIFGRIWWGKPTSNFLL